MEVMRTGIQRTLIVRVALAAAVIGGIGAAAVMHIEREPHIEDVHGQTGLLWSLNSDPTAGAGIAAPTWAVLVRTDSPSIYYKSGAANTAWTLLGSNLVGTGSVTSVACGTNLACTPSPITSTGTVATVAAPTFAGTATAANFTTAGNVTAATGIVTSGQDVTDTLFARIAAFGDLTHDGLFTFELGGAAGPTERAVSTDPNGTGAVNGSLALDTNGKLWLKSGGAGVWSTLGGGGAFYDVVLSPAALPSGGTVNDWNPGTLGRNTLILATPGFPAGTTITGMVSGSVDGRTVTIVNLDSVAVPLTYTNEDAGSTPDDRWRIGGAGSFNSLANGSTTWYWNTTLGRWQMTARN